MNKPLNYIQYAEEQGIPPKDFSEDIFATACVVAQVILDENGRSDSIFTHKIDMEDGSSWELSVKGTVKND